MTVYLTRVSVLALVEADCAQDAVNALADAVEEGRRGLRGRGERYQVLTNEDELNETIVAEFCPYSSCRCTLPHGMHSLRLSRFADACESEPLADGVEPDLKAPPREPLQVEAMKQIAEGSHR